MAEKTDKQKQDEAKRREAARKKSLENLGNILTAPGRIMESGYGAVVEGIAGFGNTLQRDALARELRAAQFEYDRNPTEKNKSRLATAKKEFNDFKKEEKKSSPKSEPQGVGKTERFSPSVTGLSGADTPTERAKSAATGMAPEYIPINPLDNNRWKNAFAPTNDGFDTVYWNQDPSMVPVSFFANSTGAIYQREDASGSPETLDSAVDRIAKQYSDSGKMNELRNALISSGLASAQDEINALTRVQALPDSNYMALDANTRSILTRAVAFGTQINIAATDSGKKAQTFEQFLKGNYSSYYKSKDTGGGSGLPKRTVNIQRKVFTPEELELSIDAFFQEYTGQGASQEDVDFLVKKLNKLSPQKTVNVRSGDTVTSTTTGGVSQAEQQLMMREAALQDPEAESYNKATTYLNYFREALASPIELG
jgi:hypothetical protein